MPSFSISPTPELIDAIVSWLKLQERDAHRTGFGHWLTFQIPRLDHYISYHAVFRHDILNKARTDCYSKASSAQLIAVNNAISYLGMIERAFRARHATIIQHYGHAISRVTAHADKNGIFLFWKEHLNKLLQVPMRE